MSTNHKEPRVELWCLDANSLRDEVTDAQTILNDDECLRASQFRFVKDRNMFILVRATLRRLLGTYLQKAPSSIDFNYNDAGKPLLETEGRLPEVSFNVSHSGELGLLGFGFGCTIGVDIEQMQPNLDFHSLARVSFSEAERQILGECVATDLMTSFYRCWTRKEAYIKALGDGISYGLDCFDVSLQPTETHLIADRNHKNSISWTFFELALRPGYAATVVADTREYQVHLSELPTNYNFQSLRAQNE